MTLLKTKKKICDISLIPYDKVPVAKESKKERKERKGKKKRPGKKVKSRK